jgi:hypothetical protein
MQWAVLQDLLIVEKKQLALNRFPFHSWPGHSPSDLILDQVIIVVLYATRKWLNAAIFVGHVLQTCLSDHLKCR